MTRYRLIIEYDGTNLAGWQKQSDRESVQGLLEAAAGKLAGTACEVVGAGRTDAGVHALAQAAHLDISKDISPYNVMHGLNYHLTPLTSQVIVLKAEVVPENFHARFSAVKRSYRYRILNRQAWPALQTNRIWHIPEPLDAEAMHAAAQHLVGHHDFTTFRSTGCQSKSPLKTLERLDVTREGDEITLVTEARSFLHHQVRNMVGTLRLVGNGKWKASAIPSALAARDRRLGGETAPPQGLYLVKVAYGF